MLWFGSNSGSLRFLSFWGIFVKPSNWQPFMPFGFSGVFNGAALVFFAFWALMRSQWLRKKLKIRKRCARGIIGSIAIATLLYIVVTLILTGIVPFTELNVNDPVAFAMRYIDHGVVGSVISVGAILTLLTVTISMMYSLARLLYAISKDGLLPKSLQKIDPKHKTPKKRLMQLESSPSFCRSFSIEYFGRINEYRGIGLLDLNVVGDHQAA